MEKLLLLENIDFTLTRNGNFITEIVDTLLQPPTHEKLTNDRRHCLTFDNPDHILTLLHQITFKGELRGKNEVILYDWPIFSTLIFNNSFC